MEISSTQKDELIVSGNSLEAVFKMLLIFNKSVVSETRISVNSWMVFMFLKEVPLLKKSKEIDKIK